MAPGTRRANRSGYAEHDDFEGLPVRQWRHDWVTVEPPPQQEQQKPNDIWSVELLYGMPKDSNLLPPHSQELLLAARSGRLYKRPAPAEEEEADADALAENKEKKEEEGSSKGFTMKIWKQVNKNVETSTVSHLAKRQKNIVTIASKTVEDKVQGPTVTRATVKRVDAAGNPYTEEVTLAEGQQVVGEIISTRVEAAPGPQGQVAAPIPAPVRKRPLPPKRKPKGGPGRGKKRVKFPLAGAQEPAAAAAPAVAIAPAGHDASAALVKSEQPGAVDIKQEVDDHANQDSEMAEGDDDDDDEGDDGDEGDEGEEGATPANSAHPEGSHVEGDKQDHEMTDAEPVPVPEPTPNVANTDHLDVEMGGNEDPSELPAPPNAVNTSPSLSLGPMVPKLEGSPLKNVIMPSPTTEAPPEIKSQAQTDVPSTTEAPQNIEPAGAITATKEDIAEPSSTTIVPPIQPSEDIAPAASISAPPAPASNSVESDALKIESPKEAALLPPPHEQVGNIASTPSADGSIGTAPDGAEKPTEQAQSTEEAVPTGPSAEVADTIMTEDAMKPEHSESTEAPVPATMEVLSAEPISEPVPEAGAEPMETEDVEMGDARVTSPAKSPDAPVASTEETNPPAVAEPTTSGQSTTPPTAEPSGGSEEPNLLTTLMSELDRQTGKMMEIETYDATESVPQPAPEPASDVVEEVAEEPSSETVPKSMDTVDEPVAESPKSADVQPSAEPPVVPPAEPAAEVVAELTPQTIPGPDQESSEVLASVNEPEPSEKPTDSEAPEFEAKEPVENQNDESVSETPAQKPSTSIPSAEAAPATEEAPAIDVPVTEEPAVDAPPVDEPSTEKQEDALIA
ncbi:hypothetical protein BGZ63DRAFT_419591 [Mariannaea sp. PMI_226]|nr:hypothetical protein BGZ63DRAFT_419591 [Mariannaea sp. PMI_226]